MTQQMNFAVFGILGVLVVLIFLGQRLIKIESRLDRVAGINADLSAKLDLLIKNAGVKYDPHQGLPPGVMEAVRNGEKIQAIKLYRDATGVGLKEAKDFIEGIQRRTGVD